MKNWFSLSFLLFAGLLFIGCSDSGTTDTPVAPPSMSVEVVDINAGSALVNLTTTSMTDFMFIAYPAEKAADLELDPTQINSNPDTIMGACTGGTQQVKIPSLQVDTDYVVYFSGITINEEYYEPLVTAEFRTLQTSKDIEIIEQDYRSVSVHVNYPDYLRTKENAAYPDKGYALRYNFVDIATYNYLESSFPTRFDAYTMICNDYFYGYYIRDDRTFHFNNEFQNWFLHDSEGNVVYDEEGAPVENYGPIVPGHKAYFMLAEYAYGFLPFNFKYGNDLYDYGYYVPTFDYEGYAKAELTNPNVDEAEYWAKAGGFYEKMLVETKAPEQGVGRFIIDKSNLASWGGTFTVKTEGDIQMYAMFVTDEQTYAELMESTLDNDESLLQWFTSSYAAVDIMYARTINVKDNPNGYLFNFEEEFIQVNHELDWIGVFVGFCDENGTKQVFHKEVFELEEPQYEEPELVITPVETGSPYRVAFNIKCASKDRVNGGQAKAGRWYCGYERDWRTANYTNDTQLILEMAGDTFVFSDQDLYDINSEEGLTYEFDSNPDSNTIFGAIIYNEERTPSETVVVESRTAAETVTPIESEYYQKLVGDWTAEATISYVAAGSNKTETMTLTRKVTLGDLDVPTTMTDEFVYAHRTFGYEGAKQIWDDFIYQLENFNDKAQKQNRIIAQGFDFQVPVENFDSELTFAAPYELLLSADYSAYNAESILWDFGPKWFIEVLPEGKLGVPFNSTVLAPMAHWSGDNAYYLIGASEKAVLPNMPNKIAGTAYMFETGYFPVEVSEDGNTITIKPLEFEGDRYYPLPAFIDSATRYWAYYNTIVSDIVLKRGWTEPEATPTSLVKPLAKRVDTLDGQMPVKQNLKSRGLILPAQSQSTETITLKVANKETFHKNFRSSLEKRGFILPEE